jgi:hypothetical protein
MLQSEIYAKDAVQFSGIAHQNRPRQNDSVVAYTLVLRRSPRTDRCTKQEMPKRGNPLLPRLQAGSRGFASKKETS